MNLQPRFGRITILHCGIAVALIFALLAQLHASLGAIRGFDESLPRTLHTFANPRLTVTMMFFTGLGALGTFFPAVAVVILWLRSKGRKLDAAILGGALLGAMLLNETLKLTFHRPRPVLPWSIGDEHTFSFPSGHALFATVLYGTLSCLALQRPVGVWRRVTVLLPALLLPPAIGMSRIYLGEHFPSDVIAGYLAGLIWLGCVIMLQHRYRAVHSPAARV